MTRLITYYHATPLENLESISRDGIKTNFGEIYCSTNAEAAGRWICFTRMHCRFIAVIPFKKTEHDLSMGLGVDHSPIMTQMLGVPDEGASFTSSEDIEHDDIEWDDIMFVHNPNYNHEYARDFHEEHSTESKLRALLDKREGAFNMALEHLGHQGIVHEQFCREKYNCNVYGDVLTEEE